MIVVVNNYFITSFLTKKGSKRVYGNDSNGK